MVAQEVRNLANRSAEAAKNTSNLIKHSIKDVETGTESTDLVVSAMQVINDCIQEIKTLMDEIAAASVKEISEVVQTNSASAAESAAVSKELSNQARMLNSLISRFHMR